jgi:hypothetical protein
MLSVLRGAVHTGGELCLFRLEANACPAAYGLRGFRNLGMLRSCRKTDHKNNLKRWDRLRKESLEVIQFATGSLTMCFMA